jgi:hypothetical protein
LCGLLTYSKFPQKTNNILQIFIIIFVSIILSLYYAHFLKVPLKINFK